MTENKENSLKKLDTILDSNLILATKSSLYDVKIVDCNNYIQVYFYENKKIRTKKDEDLELKIKNNELIKEKNIVEVKENSLKEIDVKNITRSKLKCQRLAKANMEVWETFITLTFANTDKFDIYNINDCNKRLKYFLDKVRRVKKDLKYICIPEFQKRGAVHYHLLTNISINDEKLIYSQIDNLNYKHIKYWNDGFDSVEVLKGDPKKVVGYISKYMTKDIDNRLFNKHRYFASKNITEVKENFINLDNEKDKKFYIEKIQGKQLIYQNEYTNPYDNTNVTFLEFLKTDNTII